MIASLLASYIGVLCLHACGDTSDPVNPAQTGGSGGSDSLMDGETSTTLGGASGSSGSEAGDVADASVEGDPRDCALDGPDGSCATCGQLWNHGKGCYKTVRQLCGFDGSSTDGALSPSMKKFFALRDCYCTPENCATECEYACALASFPNKACAACFRGKCASENEACDADDGT